MPSYDFIKKYILKKNHLLKIFDSNMPRRRLLQKPPLTPDPLYNSPLVHKIVNHLMKKGKKSVAYKIIYDAMTNIREITRRNPVQIIEEAVKNVTPVDEVKAKRVGGATYQVPLKVEAERGTTLSIRWLLSASRKKSGKRKTMVSKVTHEFIEASKNLGSAVSKRVEIQKIADINRAFERFAKFKKKRKRKKKKIKPSYF